MTKSDWPGTQSNSRIVENTSGEITKSAWPGTKSNSRIVENTSGEITKSAWPGTKSNSRIVEKHLVKSPKVIGLVHNLIAES